MQRSAAPLPRDFAKPEVRSFLDRLDTEEHERRRYHGDRLLQSLNWAAIAVMVVAAVWNVFGVIGFAWFVNALITRLGA